MDMDRALMLVSNRLNQIDDYPEDAGEPTLDTSGLDDNAIAWFILTKTPVMIQILQHTETLLKILYKIELREYLE